MINLIDEYGYGFKYSNRVSPNFSNTKILNKI